MMVHILFWISFGALVGCVAAILHDTSSNMRSLAYITVGALGGLTGGVGGLLLSGDGVEYNAQASGLTFSIFGAIVFVILARYADRHRTE